MRTRAAGRLISKCVQYVCHDTLPWLISFSLGRSCAHSLTKANNLFSALKCNKVMPKNSKSSKDRALKRMDNVLIVIDDLEAAKAFFIELGLPLEGETTVEGPLVGKLI